jgi:hypothetical protein
MTALGMLVAILSTTPGARLTRLTAGRHDFGVLFFSRERVAGPLCLPNLNNMNRSTCEGAILLAKTHDEAIRRTQPYQRRL